MSLSFYIVNAFTTSAHGGNPAVILLVDDFPTAQNMQNMAANFNQPMTAFLKATTPSFDTDQTSVSYDVRWFTPTSESPLCGHATLAAAGLLFSQPSLTAGNVSSIVFRAASGAMLNARKLGDWVEIRLTATLVKPPSVEDEVRIRVVLERALGKNAPIKFLAVGGEGFERYLMVEVEEAYNLADRKVNAEALMNRDMINTLRCPMTLLIQISLRSIFFL